jgi:GTP-binding protein
MTQENLPSATSIPTHEDSVIEAGRKLFSRPVNFVLGVAQLEQLPPEDKTETVLPGVQTSASPA